MENESSASIPENAVTKEFMTEPELCAFLGVNKENVSRLRRDYQLPFIAITRTRRLYRVGDLQVWLSGRKKVLNSGA